MSKRTHGTRAHGSRAGEKHDIYLFIEHFLGALWPRVETNFCHPVGLIACKRVMVPRHPSDDAVLREFLEAVNGIHDIDIGREPSAIEIDAVVAEF